MPNPIRVHHLESDQYFIVDGEDVYGDSNQDGKISKDEKLSDNPLGVKLNSIRDAGKYIQDTFAVPYPGSRNQDGSIVSAGPLNDVEAKNFKVNPVYFQNHKVVVVEFQVEDRSSG